MKKFLIIFSISAVLLVFLVCGGGLLYFFSFRKTMNQRHTQIMTTQLQEGETASPAPAEGEGINEARYELMLAVRRRVSEVIRQSEAFQLIQQMALDGQGQPAKRPSILQQLSMAAKFMTAYKDSTATLLAELEKNGMSYDEYWTLTESGFALLLIGDEQKTPEQKEADQEALEEEVRELQARLERGEQEGLLGGERTQLAMMRGIFDSSEEGKANFSRYREYWLALDAKEFARALKFIQEQREEIVQLGDSVLIDFIIQRFQQQAQGAAADDSPSTGSLTTDDKLRPAA